MLMFTERIRNFRLCMTCHRAKICDTVSFFFLFFFLFEKIVLFTNLFSFMNIY